MTTAHNIPIYKLIHALYDMQNKGYSFTDIKIEDDLNIVLRASEMNFNSVPPPLTPMQQGDINLEDLI